MIQIAKIGDLCDQIRGVTYCKEDASDKPGTGVLPILRAGNITETGLVFDDLVYVPGRCVAERQMIRKNDVVVAASSGSLEVVGKTARALCDYEGSFGAFCKVLRPNSKVDPRYFSHFFRTQAYRRIISQKAAGANINNLRSGDLDELEIPLPAFSEQRRIADILDRADALRAKRRAALARLDELTQAIFVEMFGDPIENPRQFPVRELIEIIDPARPITYGILMPGPDQPVGVPYVRVVDMKEGGIQFAGLRKTTLEISNAYRRSILKSGDIIMSIRGHVGRMAEVPPALDGANITQDTARLAITGALSVYVRECLRTISFQRWMAKHTKGVAVRGINLGDVKRMPIILPPQREQQRFVDAANAIEQQMRLFRTSSVHTDTLFASLQDRAFRGAL